MASAVGRWSAGSTPAFKIDLDINVRDTFGPGVFLVDAATSRVVSLDASGRPLALLHPGSTYLIHCGTSTKLQKQALALRGALCAAKEEIKKLRDRMQKLDACMRDEMEQLRRMAASGDNQPRQLPSPPPASTESSSLLSAALDSLPRPAVGCVGSPERVVEASWHMLPIGCIKTPFVEKNGTPRQGCIAPSAHAELRLDLAAHPPGTLNAAHALEGLSAFSHVWLLWIFDRDAGVATKSKIRPPRLDGIKTGLFSTRTPHRPNAIGLSLVRLRHIKADTLYLTGVDLCDGTPILDVKPYVPFADSVADATVAPWLAALPTPDLEVQWTAQAAAELRALLPHLSLLPSEEHARSAVNEVLAADPRSIHWRQARTAMEFGFSIDTINVVCTFENGVATINSVQHLHLCDRSHVPVARERANVMIPVPVDVEVDVLKVGGSIGK
jgi:tRNA-Thr(GGU) m(6)t(6)A37 methyltransferase TsaA